MKKIIRFTAPWCRSCKNLDPFFGRVPKDAIKVETVDIDQDPDTARKYGVTGLPTILLVEGDAVVETLIGATDHTVSRISDFVGI